MQYGERNDDENDTVMSMRMRTRMFMIVTMVLIGS